MATQGQLPTFVNDRFGAANRFDVKVIDRQERDLNDDLADIRGWSSSNLRYMRFFAQHWPDGLFGQQPTDQMP